MYTSYKNKFTLLELLVVITIAVVALSITSPMLRTASEGNALLSGVSTVQTALQTARSQAMQLNQVVYVYFLDGGVWEFNYGMDLYKLNNNRYDSTLYYTEEDQRMAPDEFVRGGNTIKTPYELMLVAGDGEILANLPLPKGVGWLALGGGAQRYSEPALVDNKIVPSTEDPQNYQFAVAKNQLLRNFKRNSSLIIGFSPGGTAWAEAAPGRVPAGNVSGEDSYKDTRRYIRVFLFDSLITQPSRVNVVYNVENEEGNSTGATNVAYGIQTDLWKIDGSGKVTNVSRLATMKGSDKLLSGERAMQVPWRTVLMNYETGFADIIDGKEEPPF